MTFAPLGLGCAEASVSRGSRPWNDFKAGSGARKSLVDEIGTGTQVLLALVAVIQREIP